ncbi:MAG: Holliday junction resolvase RuvX [Lachnospiraceae bacterium]|nr:Holliday junction resolvase RuvX [Lachnospiraceae bacterium]MDY6220757.1 Holliday junction resolvase RuvX [Candidatus Alectryocaccobium sp.]
MGLDYGSKTVGVAISDALLLTAQPVETIWRKSESKLRKTLARIDWLIEEYDVGKIVLGLPVHMNTDIGDRALKALEFKAALEKRTGLEVVMMDERLTTVEAMEVLSEAGVKSGEKKQYVDKLAAVFILQDYLNELDSKRSGS